MIEMAHSKNSAARQASQQKFRANTAKNKAKKNEAKREANARKKFLKSLPTVTEDHLLAFQLAHFGDDTKPSEWFVDSNKALRFEPEYEEEDDGLGFYDDGAKRTLTDDQIAMFRRSELWQMKRQQELAQHHTEDAASADTSQPDAVREVSPVSVASSLEDDLLAYASVSNRNIPLPNPSSRHQQPQQSDGSRNEPISNERRGSKQQVPYDERHKRKWEHYIQGHDAVQGSMTHRRLARELDDQQTETVEMDY